MSTVLISEDILNNALGGKIIIDRNYDIDNNGTPDSSVALVTDKNGNILWGRAVKHGNNGGNATTSSSGSAGVEIDKACGEYNGGWTYKKCSSTSTPAQAGGNYTLITRHDPTYYSFENEGKGAINNKCVLCAPGISGNSKNPNGTQGTGYGTGGGGGCGKYRVNNLADAIGRGGAGGIGLVTFGYTIME